MRSSFSPWEKVAEGRMRVLRGAHGELSSSTSRNSKDPHPILLPEGEGKRACGRSSIQGDIKVTKNHDLV